MSVTINGTGTISGISQGGLNDNIITAAEMATGGAWAPAGTVLQVVQAAYNTTVSTTSTSFVGAGITATITPKISTSKIAIFVSFGDVSAENSTGSINGVGIQLTRNGTSIGNTFANQWCYNGNGASTYGGINSGNINWMDAPATTSSVTYAINFKSAGSTTTAVLFRDATQGSIILMEIAA